MDEQELERLIERNPSFTISLDFPASQPITDFQDCQIEAEYDPIHECYRHKLTITGVKFGPPVVEKIELGECPACGLYSCICRGGSRR